MITSCSNDPYVCKATQAPVHKAPLFMCEEQASERAGSNCVHGRSLSAQRATRALRRAVKTSYLTHISCSRLRRHKNCLKLSDWKFLSALSTGRTGLCQRHFPARNGNVSVQFAAVGFPRWDRGRRFTSRVATSIWPRGERSATRRTVRTGDRPDGLC